MVAERWSEGRKEGGGKLKPGDFRRRDLRPVNRCLESPLLVWDWVMCLVAGIPFKKQTVQQ
jgi:hypothetical protein